VASSRARQLLQEHHLAVQDWLDKFQFLAIPVKSIVGSLSPSFVLSNRVKNVFEWEKAVLMSA
jgi:hypothetical protein